IATLLYNKWIQHRQNLIILGATGTGKSWLGCAFATDACRHHYSVLYFNTNTLFEALALAVADRTLPQLRRS
uniref:ATP-binding protein n=1 Tax=Acinetobacter seifertii TaxID=1530123 RepID=UPI00224A9B83